ncbi:MULTISPECIES: DUF3122 domain-containing protein [Synechococcus]|jgi:hypothetical protein|uniref:DUF3122 domain-containing protein n=1 Tax=Synechococcus lacustris str. Tous TaxID=1910958 RepID=A0A2P7EFH6_9SYNE|nr:MULTISPECIES: DUF3122 domain-containing protein [Synechococcus]MCF8135495.1 DUF3122 domain-containing protein [Synechococcus lacustris]NBV58851.1 DUF3122 domain-containing protein [Synechococcaceae bacterium WB4_2_0811]MCP9794505.1 DUF3122 domain-containing protein [Synechococcus lacustris L1F-Slac]MCP9926058.1 DUF3122 domain-containing protein [Synechococcus lacustris C3-12m-Tous]OON11768.1 MAG: hypothetical protein BTM30_08165 [Synechococcus lacustris str. Tous]
MERILGVFIALALLLLPCGNQAAAQLQSHNDGNGVPVLRSIESLRDLDYQAWQLVAYREGEAGGPLRLRVVGYPGKVRLNHPTALEVFSGERHWALTDITLNNPTLSTDSRDAAAEFDLAPLLSDIKKNRPLRLVLPGVFTELPVPPFVVKEWRELPNQPL